jgi:fructose-1,6-bisphosphatase I
LPETLDPEAPLCVAIDPLDGSANLENNISVGTIFSIRPRGNDIISTFFEPGTAQVAAGFTVYGPQTTLVLALDARLYVGSTDNFLYCLNSRDGRIEWRWRTGADVHASANNNAESNAFSTIASVTRGR